MRAGERPGGALRAHRELRVQGAQARRQPSRTWARGSSARRRSRRSRSCSRTSPTTTSRSRRASARRRRATSSSCPILFEGEVKAVIELASFLPFSQIHQTFLDQLAGIDRRRAEHDSGEHAHRGAAASSRRSSRRSCRASRRSCSSSRTSSSSRTRSSSAGAHAAGSPRSCSRSSRKSCSRSTRSSRRRRSLLAEQNTKVEQKNREVEAARVALEEKAEQLVAVARSTRASSWRTCRTSCARRSTRCSSSPSCCRRTRTGTSRTKQVEYAQTILRVGHRPAQPDQRHARPVEGRGGEDGGERRPRCR